MGDLQKFGWFTKSKPIVKTMKSVKQNGKSGLKTAIIITRKRNRNPTNTLTPDLETEPGLKGFL